MDVECKCKNECPACGSTDIDWSGWDVADKWFSQDATCNECDTSFQETSEIVYQHTEIRV